MNKTLSIFLIFIGFIAFGQSAKIDTLNLKASERFKELQSDKMNFPIINSGKTEIDSLINFDLKNKFTQNEYPNESIDSTLLKWAGDQIIFLDFNVSYNRNGILSLSVSAEGCGAYCTYWTDYYNYSLKTGQALTLSDIVDTSGAFKILIFEQKDLQFEKQKTELKKMMLDKESGLDENTYEVALEYYEKCDNSFNLENFVIKCDSLEIICDCYLPHVMKNLTPIIELKYKLTDITEYLKIKN